ncbi:hypothetical protein TWF694_003397 [Orbilia ellipsospora]|uniref:HMG box domain-containing protein n=1 Tax=Orbilia ellipsospora TaxID=2528407 RepID=A0AAV9WZ35_9PEZI
MSDLRDALDRLGLSQYMGRLLDEGFDRWDTVLDIQESDLAYMGFKLGHRRILQRAIARERGIPENDPIPWLYQQPYTEDTGDEPDDKSSPRGYRPDYKGVVQTKRKYRRHPRPDENAPEKPPSAYVMFANNVREELKGQSLSFTDIARLVGEKWKVLEPDQKEEYEYQATTMKERYNQELSAYKKTDNYKEYAQYLLEFKTKEAAKEAGEASFTPTPDVPRKRPNISGVSVGGVVPVSHTSSSSRSHQQQHPGESPSYPQPASIAAGHYAQHGRRESYHSPFTQPSTPASQMVSPINFSESSTGSGHVMRQYPPGAGPNSYEREAVTLSFRDSPGRSTHMQYYDQSRPPHGEAGPRGGGGGAGPGPGGHPEGYDQGLMQLPKINAQPHIQQVLSFSRGQPSPGDSPSQHPRRSGSISDGDGRQIHGHSLRALPPLRNPSPSQRGSSSYFTQRPTRDLSGSGTSGAGYPGHGSTSSSPRGQLASVVEQKMRDQSPRRSGEGTDQS